MGIDDLTCVFLQLVDDPPNEVVVPASAIVFVSVFGGVSRTSNVARNHILVARSFDVAGRDRMLGEQQVVEVRLVGDAGVGVVVPQPCQTALDVVPLALGPGHAKREEPCGGHVVGGFETWRATVASVGSIAVLAKPLGQQRKGLLCLRHECDTGGKAHGDEASVRQVFAVRPLVTPGTSGALVVHNQVDTAFDGLENGVIRVDLVVPPSGQIGRHRRGGDTVSSACISTVPLVAHEKADGRVHRVAGGIIQPIITSGTGVPIRAPAVLQNGQNTKPGVPAAPALALGSVPRAVGFLLFEDVLDPKLAGLPDDGAEWCPTGSGGSGRDDQNQGGHPRYRNGSWDRNFHLLS